MRPPVAAVFVLLLTAGCGQRGELFIPEPEREVVASVPVGAAAVPAPEPGDDDEEENRVAPPPADPVQGR